MRDLDKEIRAQICETLRKDNRQPLAVHLRVHDTQARRFLNKYLTLDISRLLSDLHLEALCEFARKYTALS